MDLAAEGKITLYSEDPKSNYGKISNLHIRLRHPNQLLAFI